MRCVDYNKMRNTRATQLLFELSEARPPRASLAGVRRARAAARRAAAGRARSPPRPRPAGAGRARRRAALHEPVAAEHVGRHALLSARLLHDEVQPQAERAARAAAGLRRPASAISPKTRCRACSQLLFELQEYARRDRRACPPCSLQPAAGAHGELTALLVAAAYFRDRGEKRTKVLAPDSAHGTNPASAAIAGFETRHGQEHAERLRRPGRSAAPSSTTRSAVFMITNPNTLGMFEPQMRADRRHWSTPRGGLIYLDGANMNAILGIARPGDFGADMMHYNPHKTFSGPHGGGGPGAGPIAVREMLGAVSCRRRSSSKDGDALPPRLRPAQVDRPRPQLLRQHRRARAGLLLHPHARPRRACSASARTRCSTPTIC